MSDVRGQIEATLSDFWDKQAVPAAVIDNESTSSVVESPIDLDSISSCEVLVLVKPILGKDIKAESVIKRGGYSSKDEFVRELTKALLEDKGSSES